MIRLRTAAVLTVVLLALGSACSAAPQAPSGKGPGPFTVDVDVDTPQLRAIKQKAGVERCQKGERSDVAGEEGLPDLVLACLGGGPDVDLSSLSGPLVINLWASWCGPCRDELPYFQQLNERANGKVKVLGVDYQDTQPEAALELVRETGVTYPLLADPAGEVRVPFEVRGLPGVVFVNRKGEVTHIEYVVARSYGQLRDLVEKHLDVTL
ncbi:MAG: TlpA family protein disulfide reductase [Actinomycetota bacterium]|nr:TlpA family protein disulfide reductase [Actinomycetota bacterium]